MTRADVVVIGGGPAGCAAAISLAGAGRRVRMLDKATFPRDKCCGDGLTTLALRELEALGLRPGMVPSWRSVDAAWVRTPRGRTVSLPLPRHGVFAATAPRAELDQALLELARAAGVDVVEGHPVQSVVDGLSTTAVDGVEAAFVIAADGMWSPTRKLLGLDEAGYRGEWYAARQYVSQVHGSAADQLHVWFERDLGAGYAWSFPLPDGRANVGFGVLRSDGRSGRDLKRLWDVVTTRPHIVDALGADAQWNDRVTAWPIPAAIDRATLSHGRVLFVGDAARASDVLTGEGIGQAVLTGRLAAEAIIGHDAARPEQAARAYERSVRAHLFADHRTSRVLSRVVARPTVVDVGLRLTDTSTIAKHALARWMFEDARRSSLMTPWRWRAGEAPRPGAFV